VSVRSTQSWSQVNEMHLEFMYGSIGFLLKCNCDFTFHFLTLFLDERRAVQSALAISDFCQCVVQLTCSIRFLSRLVEEFLSRLVNQRLMGQRNTYHQRDKPAPGVARFDLLKTLK
jgi:hypothetical protein